MPRRKGLAPFFDPTTRRLRVDPRQMASTVPVSVAAGRRGRREAAGASLLIQHCERCGRGWTCALGVALLVGNGGRCEWRGGGGGLLLTRVRCHSVGITLSSNAYRVTMA